MIYLGSDTVFTWDGMADCESNYINSATVTGTIKTLAGTTVTSFSMPYVAASNGDYRGYVTKTMAALLTEGTEYIVDIVATYSTYQETRSERHLADYRGYE